MFSWNSVVKAVWDDQWLVRQSTMGVDPRLFQCQFSHRKEYYLDAHHEDITMCVLIDYYKIRRSKKFLAVMCKLRIK